MDITLPVSLGEALDKLSILEIKLKKISEIGRRRDVQTEYDILFAALESYVKRWAYYYKLLFEINLDIWELQDKFHGKDVSAEEGAKICKKILEENDRRFRVKSKLNHSASSNLREQKGYAKKKAFIYTHLGLGDMFWMNGAVRYLATAYDEVVVVCKARNRKNVEMMYVDDPSIRILTIEDDYVLYPIQQTQQLFKNDGYEVFRCGYHTDNPRIYDFPHSFYDDLGMDRAIRTRYFHVPNFLESDEMYEKVKAVSTNYIVVHQQSSGKKMNIWGHVANRVNPNEIAVLDINENHYSEEHPFFEIAQWVVGKPMLHYKRLLEEANQIHLLESSMYCFVSHLDLSRVQKKICYDAFDNSNERLGIFESGKL